MVKQRPTTEYIHLASLEELHFRLWLQGEEHVWDRLSEIWDEGDDNHIEAITATIDNGYSVIWDEGAKKMTRSEFPSCVKLLTSHIGMLTNCYIFIAKKEEADYGQVYVAQMGVGGEKNIFYAPRNP